MTGILKGALTGLAAFAAGFALLAVILPPEVEPPVPEPSAAVATPEPGAPAAPDPTQSLVAAAGGMAPQDAPAPRPSGAATGASAPAPEARPEAAPEVAPEPVAEAAPEPAPQAVAPDPATPAAETTAAAPASPAAPPPAVAVVPDPAAAPVVEAADPSPRRQVEPGNQPTAGAGAPPPAEEEEVPLGPPGVGNPPPPALAAGPDAPADGAAPVRTGRLPQIGAPAPGAAEAQGEGVRIGRLPQIGADPAPAAEPEAAPATAPEPAAGSAGAPAEAPATRLPRAVTPPPAPAVAEAPAPAPEATPEPSPAPTAEAPAAVAEGAEGAAATATAPDPVPEPAPEPAPDPVRTGRLPQVGAAPAAADTAAAPAVEPSAEPPAAAAGAGSRLPQVGVAPEAPVAEAPPPPWQRFRALTGDGARPPLGLVLLDPARALETEAALVGFPVPVTVALDPFDTDAPRRAQAYRAAGHEVVLAIDGIAPGATASDLEVLLEAWGRDFPEALGLIELPPGEGRRARALAPVVIPALQARGLALVAPDRGLSPMLAAGRAAGLPLVGLYRALDAADEDDATIRRQLDRAAFEAERLGRIAVFARADRPTTRDAILGWLQGGARAGRVAPGAAGAVLVGP